MKDITWLVFREVRLRMAPVYFVGRVMEVWVKGDGVSDWKPADEIVMEYKPF